MLICDNKIWLSVIVVGLVLRKKRVIHIITGLSVGGAENMLYKLLSASDRKSFEYCVVSLTDIGPIGEKLIQYGIPVYAIGIKGNGSNPFSFFYLVKLLRKLQPEVVQTWMYHADLIGGLAVKLAGHAPVVWGIRNSDLDAKNSSLITKAIVMISALLSRWIPQVIVCCSQEAGKIHQDLGYVAHKMVFIPNGFDLSLFRPNKIARMKVRKEIGVSEEKRLVGVIARYDHQKDIGNFLKAAAILYSQGENVEFLLCGSGMDWSNSKLITDMDALGLRGSFHLLGLRDDVQRIMAALDVAVLSSAYGEAFPNVLGEAMACGVVCVATNVGDSALIIGRYGKVVPPREPIALSEALSHFISKSDEELAQLAIGSRKSIDKRFSLTTIVSCYEKLYEEVAG